MCMQQYQSISQVNSVLKLPQNQFSAEFKSRNFTVYLAKNVEFDHKCCTLAVQLTL
jgi:hypothetical protein